jgi:hypothetical protein
MAVDVMRIDVGFQGGQVLPLRATKEAYEALARALEGNDGGRWHKLETQDSEILIDLPQVVYVRRDVEEHRVGF